MTSAGLHQPDLINHPPHYKGAKWESIEIIEALGLGPSFHIGNALKYLFRYQNKGGRQDVEKALWYLKRVLGDRSLAREMSSIDVNGYDHEMADALANFGIVDENICSAIERLASISTQGGRESENLGLAISDLERFLSRKD